MLTSRFNFARGPYQQDGPLMCLPRQMLPKVQTGAIGPVQVIEQHGQRRLLGERPQEATDLPEEPLLRVAVAALRRRCGALHIVGQQPGHLRPALYERRQYARLEERRLGERLEEWGVGERLLRLVAAPTQDAKACSARQQCDLLRQPRLAHAWLADENEHPPLPTDNRLHRIRDEIELSPTSHQLAGRERTQEPADRPLRSLGVRFGALSEWEGRVRQLSGGLQGRAFSVGKVQSIGEESHRRALGSAGAAFEHADVDDAKSCRLGQLRLRQASGAARALERDPKGTHGCGSCHG
jgi:hypothetical protein